MDWYSRDCHFSIDVISPLIQSPNLLRRFIHPCRRHKDLLFLDLEFSSNKIQIYSIGIVDVEGRTFCHILLDYSQETLSQNEAPIHPYLRRVNEWYRQRCQDHTQGRFTHVLTHCRGNRVSTHIHRSPTLYSLAGVFMIWTLGCCVSGPTTMAAATFYHRKIVVRPESHWPRKSYRVCHHTACRSFFEPCSQTPHSSSMLTLQIPIL